MSTSSINSLSGILVQNYFSFALPNTGATNTNTTSIGGIPFGTQTDSSRLSPFAELFSNLQKLQQSDPVKYVALTQKIADNLHTAAQAAQKGRQYQVG